LRRESERHLSHEAASYDGRQKSIGRQRLRVQAAPAHEHLGTARTPRAQIDLGLKPRLELVAAQGGRHLRLVGRELDSLDHRIALHHVAEQVEQGLLGRRLLQHSNELEPIFRGHYSIDFSRARRAHCGARRAVNGASRREPAQELEAVHLRHVDVADDERERNRGFARHERQCTAAVLASSTRDTPRTQQPHEHAALKL